MLIVHVVCWLRLHASSTSLLWIEVSIGCLYTQVLSISSNTLSHMSLL